LARRRVPETARLLPYLERRRRPAGYGA
jgi:hypothetical protein